MTEKAKAPTEKKTASSVKTSSKKVDAALFEELEILRAQAAARENTVRALEARIEAGAVLGDPIALEKIRMQAMDIGRALERTEFVSWLRALANPANIHATAPLPQVVGALVARDIVAAIEKQLAGNPPNVKAASSSEASS